ncbi:hypothetical protein LCGC14_2495590, partial [marine sediment metagenome]
ALSFFLVDWRSFYWATGTDSVDEFQLKLTTGTFDTTNLVTMTPSGATFTPSAVGGVNPDIILTTGAITGTPTVADTLLQATSSAAGTMLSFVHDVDFADVLPGVSIVRLLTETSINQKLSWLGLCVNTWTLNSARGERISIDIDMVGMEEPVPSSIGGLARAAPTKSAWIWHDGSIVLNSDNYNPVCDNLSLEVQRNARAVGGHDFLPDDVIAGIRKAIINLEMDLGTMALRTLRQANTKFSLALTFIDTVNTFQAVLTFTNCQLTEEPIEVSRDGDVIRVAASMQTGSMSGRIHSDIFNYGQL